MINNKRKMLSAIIAAIATLRQLAERRDGAIAIIFGLCAIPAVIAAGMAIDVGRAYMVKIRLGAALDAAALAVGSETNQTATQLTSDLQNYFTANYPSSALGMNVTITPVPANADLTASTVTFQAQATVPMTFMQLVGVNNINVTVTAQTKKTSGLEVAVVLDNTGSMLCGPNDGAPNYSDASCGGSVVSSDTACTNASNQSRICTLINAATQFVNTLTSAISSAQQLYISVVPYVTTVNVGNSFCTGATSCSHITTDSCSGDFLDDKAHLIYHAETVSSTKATATVTASLTSGTSNATSIASTSNILVGMAVSGTGIPSNTYVKTVSSTSITLSANYTGTTGSGKTLTLGPAGNMDATPTSSFTGSTVLNFPTAPSPALTAGMVVTGNGIPSNTAIQTVNSTTQITLCNATTAASPGALSFYMPVTYDTAYNTASPAGSSTSSNWGGCVIEPTSSDENSSVSGVINSATADPDYTEPGSWPSWYPFWWATDSGDNWATNGIKAQSTATETQGSVVTDWLTLYGPNQGCPVPIVPLTDVTTTAGKTQVLNSISSMWPRDAGGTQVHIGMIWGWRVLSPNGPFTPSNGHPLSYSTASTTGWKKVIVLMTDGTEEWPATDNLTGLGQLADGKIGTSSSTSTAQSNLDTRLASVCSNLAANGNYIIYTIGLGSDGASNTQLQNCATTSNGGFFEAATPTNLQTVFNNIAKSLIALRLTQ